MSLEDGNWLNKGFESVRASKNKIYIAKKKIQTFRQDEVGKLVKAERTTRKQVIRKLLFVAPFVWIPFLFRWGFYVYYHCVCVAEGMRIDRYELLQKVETTLCPKEALRSLEWKREYARGGSELIIVQYHSNNQAMTLFAAPGSLGGIIGSRISADGRITRYVNKIKSLTKQGQSFWFFPCLIHLWLPILFLLLFTYGIGMIWIEASAEEPKDKANHT